MKLKKSLIRSSLLSYNSDKCTTIMFLYQSLKGTYTSPEDQVGFHALWLDIFISLCRHCLKGFVKIGWNFGRGQSLGGLWEVFTIKKACICTAWPCKVNNILDRNENVTVIVFYFYPRIFLFHWYGCWCYPFCCRWFTIWSFTRLFLLLWFDKSSI